MPPNYISVPRVPFTFSKKMAFFLNMNRNILDTFHTFLLPQHNRARRRCRTRSARLLHSLPRPIQPMQTRTVSAAVTSLKPMPPVCSRCVSFTWRLSSLPQRQSRSLPPWPGRRGFPAYFFDCAMVAFCTQRRTNHGNRAWHGSCPS